MEHRNAAARALVANRAALVADATAPNSAALRRLVGEDEAPAADAAIREAARRLLGLPEADDGSDLSLDYITESGFARTLIANYTDIGGCALATRSRFSSQSRGLRLACQRRRLLAASLAGLMPRIKYQLN